MHPEIFYCSRWGIASGNGFCACDAQRPAKMNNHPPPFPTREEQTISVKKRLMGIWKLDPRVMVIPQHCGLPERPETAMTTFFIFSQGVGTFLMKIWYF